MQARETRRQIATAARGLFIEYGYSGTTIDAIASDASVSPETIYSIFGSKKKILWHLMDISIGGDDQDVHLLDRPDPQKVLRETDPARLVQKFSRDITDILTRAAPMMEVLRSAAKSDHDLDDLVQNLLKERLENMTRVVQQIAKNKGLRKELDIPRAAQLVWTITSPEVFLLLTRDQHYSREDFIAWLQATLSRLLFGLIFRSATGLKSGRLVEQGP